MAYGLYVIAGAVLGGALAWLACGIKARKNAEDLRNRLAVAEEKNVRMPKLELAIGENEKQIADLAGQITALKDDIIQKADRIATLNLEIFERTEASKNKLAMVNDTQSRLCQALIALSETALNCDNDEFIQAMESNLSTFEESLLGDISRWQARHRAVTDQVCEMAESEQTAPALADQDKTLEGLILADDATEESTGGSGEEPDAPGSDETDNEDTYQDDLAVQRTEAELALFEKKLDEEISSEFDGDDDDDDGGEDDDGDDGDDDNDDDDGDDDDGDGDNDNDNDGDGDDDDGDDGDDGDDALEENESAISPAANEERNGLTKNLFFPTQGITVRFNLAQG